MGLKVIKANQEELNKKLYEINGLLVNLISALGLKQVEEYQEPNNEIKASGLINEVNSEQNLSYQLTQFTITNIKELYTIID